MKAKSSKIYYTCSIQLFSFVVLCVCIHLLCIFFCQDFVLQQELKRHSLTNEYIYMQIFRNQHAFITPVLDTNERLSIAISENAANKLNMQVIIFCEPFDFTISEFLIYSHNLVISIIFMMEKIPQSTQPYHQMFMHSQCYFISVSLLKRLHLCVYVLICFVFDSQCSYSVLKNCIYICWYDMDYVLVIYSMMLILKTPNRRLCSIFS